MSGVVLTAATAQVTPTAEPDPILKATLPGPPTTRREFYPIDVLALYAEVYDKLQTDVPHTVDVTTRLVSETGKEVTRTADARKSNEFQARQGRRLLRLQRAGAARRRGAGPLHAPGRGQGAHSRTRRPCAARC